MRERETHRQDNPLPRPESAFYNLPVQDFRVLRRWTVRLLTWLTISSIAVFVSFSSGVVHRYGNEVGRTLMFICVCLLVGSLLIGGAACTIWSYMHTVSKGRKNGTETQ